MTNEDVSLIVKAINHLALIISLNVFALVITIVSSSFIIRK